MTRWALRLEYDGTPFVGWQRQGNGGRGELLSVQLVLETAASKLAAGAPVGATAAGRTDSGVHAEGQVAHIDLDAAFTAERLRSALNFHMRPHPVVVVQAAPVAAGWSARFSALGRSYRYRILNRPARPARAAGQVWHQPHWLDAEAMHAAAQSVLGTHDFTSFRATACQAKSPLRTLDRLEVRRVGEEIEIVAAARSFLHHQVRNLVGSLKLVGDGRWPVAKMAQVLAARDRAEAGPTAPAEGLCFTGVVYDPDPFA